MPDKIDLNARELLVQEMPHEVLRYLYSSRYCEVDKFSAIAGQLFGTVRPGWSRVQAISDWVHNRITFGYQYADPSKTAWDVYTNSFGVCRDFQHLAVTMCRALGIPARYATGYLGDFGVPLGRHQWISAHGLRLIWRVAGGLLTRATISPASGAC